MSDEKPRQAIVPIETRMPDLAAPSGNRLVERAVADVASSIRARRTSPQIIMRRVGEREFLENDYHQLMIWAELLGFGSNVDAVAAHLSDAYRVYGNRWSRNFGPVVKVDCMMREVIQNEETKEPFA